MANPGGSRQGPRKTEHAEKPYELIPFARDNPTRAAATGHGILARSGGDETLTGVIHFALTTLTPLHVAMGIVGLAPWTRSEEFAALPVVNQRYTDDPSRPVAKVPVLPGSSLKGAVRSAAEALSASCLPVVEERIKRSAQRLKSCTDPLLLCPACRIFGNTSYSGHVLVGDICFAPQDLHKHTSPVLWQPARGSGLRRRYLARGGPVGRKFYVHRTPAGGRDVRVAVRQGVTVAGQVTFEGLRPADLGLLVAALGADPDCRFPIKVGGGKPVGLGSVRVQVDQVELLAGRESGSRLRRTGRLGRVGASGIHDPESRLTGDVLARWLRERVQEAVERGVLIECAYEELKRVYTENGLQKPAPGGPY